MCLWLEGLLHLCRNIHLDLKYLQEIEVYLKFYFSFVIIYTLFPVVGIIFHQVKNEILVFY